MKFNHGDGVIDKASKTPWIVWEEKEVTEQSAHVMVYNLHGMVTVIERDQLELYFCALR
jgi:hypothetical protein